MTPLQGRSIGKLLFYQLSANEIPGEIEKIANVVRDMVLAENRSVRQMDITAGREKNILLDGQAMKRLAADKERHQYAGRLPRSSCCSSVPPVPTHRKEFITE